MHGNGNPVLSLPADHHINNVPKRSKVDFERILEWVHDKEFHTQRSLSILGFVDGGTCMEPGDEVQKTDDWDKLSPPTLTDISQIEHIGGRVEYD
jgi:hypothetical protein